MGKIYMCVDLKSFYASVECCERNLDPLTTNLVVADESRTQKTICLAVSPSLKKYGLSGRSRLFEVISKVKEINRGRKRKIFNRPFVGSSYDSKELAYNHNLELDYIVATPRMSLYMQYSTRIYNIYLKYLAPEDIYVYSIDEVFCDITNYLNYYGMSAYNLVTKIIQDIYNTTGITATGGIGTNLYLAKIAMDIVAKHVSADKNGVRIATLDEFRYRKLLWNHRPLTDFWRVGRGYAKKLEANCLYTMGDIARCSIDNEDLLYKLFGVNAEILIDHAWGWEPVTIADIKNYIPKSHCITSGQVLHNPYNYEQTKLVVREMADSLALDLVDRHLVTSQIILTIGYDIENLNRNDINYDGELSTDHYGRKIPKHASGSIKLDYNTSSSNVIIEKTITLYNQIINPDLLVRRINISANNVVNENLLDVQVCHKQFDLFSNTEELEQKLVKQRIDEQKERRLQKIMLDIKNKYGKNSILKAMNLEEGAKQIERNQQIGGHKA